MVCIFHLTPVLERVYKLLSLKDRLQLRLVCRYTYVYSHDQSVWNDIKSLTFNNIIYAPFDIFTRTISINDEQFKIASPSTFYKTLLTLCNRITSLDLYNCTDTCHSIITRETIKLGTTHFNELTSFRFNRFKGDNVGTNSISLIESFRDNITSLNFGDMDRKIGAVDSKLWAPSNRAPG